MEQGTDGGIILNMNNINTTKWIGWLQGALYTLGGGLVSSLIVALGQGGALYGTLPPVSAIVVAGLLSILDDILTKRSGGTTAVFGFVNRPN